MRRTELQRMRERLAALAHEQWSGWMRYVFHECGHLDALGNFVINAECVTGWMRQMQTPYVELSEREKDLDRCEADRVLAVLDEVDNEALEARAEEDLQQGRYEDFDTMDDLLADLTGDGGAMRNEARDFVAEHVMGFERQRCQGTTGWGDSGGGGGFYCDWCGHTRSYSDASPCPNYPFPSFTLIELMRKLGKDRFPVMVRYDIMRKERCFTVVGPEGRVADADDPLGALCVYLKERYEAEAAEEATGSYIREALEDCEYRAVLKELGEWAMSDIADGTVVCRALAEFYNYDVGILRALEDLFDEALLLAMEVGPLTWSDVTFGAVLARAETLMEAAPNSLEEQELEALAEAIEEYEREHYMTDATIVVPDSVLDNFSAFNAWIELSPWAKSCHDTRRGCWTCLLRSRLAAFLQGLRSLLQGLWRGLGPPHEFDEMAEEWCGGMVEGDR